MQNPEDREGEVSVGPVPETFERDRPGISALVALQSAITGYFISVDVPQVPVGEDIIATINFYATNPGAILPWATFLVADSPGLGVRRLLDKAREVGEGGGRKKTYTLGTMPDYEIGISFFIFAHDDWTYDWDWSEFEAWMAGFPVEVTHLASAYRFLSPGEPPIETETFEIDITPVGTGYVTTSPPDVNGKYHFEHNETGEFEYGATVLVTAHPESGYEFDHWSDEIEGGVSYNNPEYVKPMTEYRAVKAHFREIEEPPPPPAELSGMITRVAPLEFAIGQPVDLKIDFNAYVETIWEQVKGWDTRLIATLNGLSDSDIQYHIGRDGSRTGETLNLGTMPNRTLAGILVLEGRGKDLFGFPTDWVELDRRSLTIIATEAPPEPPIPPEYKLIQHTEYPHGKTYVGKAEQCTFEFKLLPEQIPGTPWLGIKIANAFADEVAKQNAEMLDLKVYEDTTPTFWTNYIVVATATASPVPWAVIIVGVLAILFIVALTFLVREVKSIDWGKAAVPITTIAIVIAALAGLGIIVATRKEKGVIA